MDLMNQPKRLVEQTFENVVEVIILKIMLWDNGHHFPECGIYAKSVTIIYQIYHVMVYFPIDIYT